jgi:chromosome segregation ATPase
MRRAALAVKEEYEEVPMNANETLETVVAAIRVDVMELKSNAASTAGKIEQLQVTTSRLEIQIGAVAAKAENDLAKFSDRVDTQFAEIRQDLREMRGEDKALREKVDVGHQTLSARIETVNEKLTAKIDATNEKLGQLDRKVTDIGSKLTALLWVVGGLGSLITISVTAGKGLHWF